MSWTDKDDATLDALNARKAEWKGVVMPALLDSIGAVPGSVIEFQGSFNDVAGYFAQREVADRWITALLPFSSFHGVLTDAPTTSD